MIKQQDDLVPVAKRVGTAEFNRSTLAERYRAVDVFEQTIQFRQVARVAGGRQWTFQPSFVEMQTGSFARNRRPSSWQDRRTAVLSASAQGNAV